MNQLVETKMLSTPFVAQRGNHVAAEWHDAACGVACVAMCLGGRVSLQQLINEGVAHGGFGERGWKHDALVHLLHEHGTPAHREEFRDADALVEYAKREEGYARIKHVLLNEKPVIVSIKKSNGSYHMILVVGVSGEGYIVHDPEIGPHVMLSEKEFASMWRGLAIFVD